MAFSDGIGAFIDMGVNRPYKSKLIGFNFCRLLLAVMGLGTSSEFLMAVGVVCGAVGGLTIGKS